MALLTIPSVTKGTAVSVSLNKTDLFALAAVAADAYFSVQSNVKRCIIEFNSDPGNQRKILDFDLSQVAPTASFLVSLRGRDSYLFERMFLEDNDGGLLILERSQLPSELDISLEALASITWTSDVASSNYLGTATSIKKLSTTSWFNLNVVSNQTLSGTVIAEMTVSSEIVTNQWGLRFGIQSGSANSSNGLAQQDYYFNFPGPGYLQRVTPIKNGEDFNYQNGFPIVAGDVLSIQAGNGVVVFKRNGVAFRTMTDQVLASSYKLGATLQIQDSEITNISFTSSGSSGSGEGNGGESGGGGGGGGSPSSGSTTVSSLWKSTGDDPVWPTANYTSDTATWSVESGTMTLSLSLNANSPSGVVDGGNGTYYLDIPSGFAISASLADGTIVGSGTGVNSYGTFSVEGKVQTVGGVKKIGLWIPVAGSGWWNSGFGGFFFQNGPIALNMTATFAVDNV